MINQELMVINQKLLKVNNIMTDNQILYTATIICFILILLSFKFNKQFGIINLIVFLLYSIRMYYGLFYQSKYGTALTWWFYLVILTGLQFLIVGIYLIVKLIRK